MNLGWVTNTTQKAWSVKGKNDKLKMKLKNLNFKFCFNLKKKCLPQIGRKYLQNTHLIKDLYPEYTKNLVFYYKKTQLINERRS